MNYHPRSYNNQQKAKPRGAKNNFHRNVRTSSSFDDGCSLSSSDSTVTDAPSLYSEESTSLASSPSSSKTHTTKKNRGKYNSYHNQNKTKYQGHETKKKQQEQQQDQEHRSQTSSNDRLGENTSRVQALHHHQHQHQPNDDESKMNAYRNNDGLNIPPPSSFVAMDCEMVGIGPGGYESSCAKVTMVDWDGQPLLDAYIQQTEPVTDYRTFVSGITADDLSGATMTMADCRVEVMKILQQRPILVGHALKNDLRALRINYPWYLTRDTAMYGPFMKTNHHMPGVLRPRKLKDLVQERLHMDIQVVGKPHSSLEDAIAAFDLYKSVQLSWEGMVKHQMDKANALHHQRRMMMMAQQQAHHYQYHHQQQHHYSTYHPQQEWVQ